MITSKHTVTLRVGEPTALYKVDFECDLAAAFEVLYSIADNSQFVFDIRPFFSLGSPSEIIMAVVDGIEDIEEAKETETSLLAEIKSRFEDIYG